MTATHSTSPVAFTKIHTVRPPEGGIGSGRVFDVHDSLEATLKTIARRMLDSHRIITRLEVRNRTILAKGVASNGYGAMETSCEISEAIPDQILIDEPETFARLVAGYESRKLKL